MKNREHKPENEVPTNSSQHEPQSSTFQFSRLKARNTNEVVQSIKRRVWNGQHTECATKPRPALRKSASLDTLLSELFPAFKDLPSEAKVAFSLDQFRPKQALPYETILGMYPQKGSWSRQAAGDRTRGMSEPIRSQMERRYSDLGGGSEETEDESSEEQREGKGETDMGDVNEFFRQRSSVVVRRKAKRHLQRGLRRETQELSQ